MWLDWLTTKLKSDKDMGDAITSEEPGVSSLQLREQILSSLKDRSEHEGPSDLPEGDHFENIFRELVQKSTISWVDSLFGFIDDYASVHNAGVSNPELQVRSELPRLFTETPAYNTDQPADKYSVCYKGMYGTRMWRLVILGYRGKIGVYLLPKEKLLGADNTMESQIPLVVLTARDNQGDVIWTQGDRVLKEGDLKFIARDLLAELLKAVGRDVPSTFPKQQNKESSSSHIELLKPEEFGESGESGKKPRPKYAFTTTPGIQFGEEEEESQPFTHTTPDVSVYDLAVTLPDGTTNAVSQAWHVLLKMLDHELEQEHALFSTLQEDDEVMEIHREKIRRIKKFRQKLLLMLLEWQTVLSDDL